jgi:MFS family permease
VAVGCTLAVVLLAAATWHLLRYRDPLVQLRVLRVRTLRITVSAGSLYRLVITAVPFLLPLQFQLVFGWTPFLSGLLVGVLFLGNIAIKPATTPLMRRCGIRRVLLVNALLSVACFALLASVRPGMSIVAIAAILFVSGILRSVGFTAYNSLAFSDVDGDDLTHANTLNAAVQELAAGLGIAIAAFLLSTFTPLATSTSAGSAYGWTFLVLGALMLTTVAETLRLPRDAGAAVTAAR